MWGWLVRSRDVVPSILLGSALRSGGCKETRLKFTDEIWWQRQTC